ncbi:MAG: hypothetical protein V7K89_27470 [Nostoc sp.]|uniref:hypothetical protein n=1 Tax=Nostoc sp. TaxID=1180 RepID=UPI002FFA6DD1
MRSTDRLAKKLMMVGRLRLTTSAKYSYVQALVLNACSAFFNPVLDALSDRAIAVSATLT